MSLSTTGTLSGTEIELIGTGTIQYPTSTGVLRNVLRLNPSGTTTFATGTFRYNTGTIIYVGGTVDASGCDLVISVGTTLSCGSPVVWKTLTVTGTITLTLSVACYVSGLVSLGGTTLTTTISSNPLYCGGGLTINGTTAVIVGDAILVLSGTGTFTVNTTTSVHTSVIWIDAGAGTVTTSGTIRYPFNKFRYRSGTVKTDAGTWAKAGLVAKQMIIQSIGTY
jgi:hypothetical protein